MRILLSLILLCLCFPAYAAESGSVFERVLKTRELRCAYTIYPTFVEKDPNTGEFTGMFYDLVEEVSAQLDIKINWVEEVGTDAIFNGLGTGRYDAVCAGYFGAPSRAFGGDFTNPLVFIPYNAYVKADNTALTSLDQLNNETITFASMDGELSSLIIAKNYPKAAVNSLPGLTPATDRLEMLATGKVDVTLMEAAIASEYMEANPGKINSLLTRLFKLAAVLSSYHITNTP